MRRLHCVLTMSCSGLLRFSSDLHEGSCDLFRLQELLTYDLPQNNNPTNYWSLLNYLFDPTDGKTGAGLNYIRVPLVTISRNQREKPLS